MFESLFSPTRLGAIEINNRILMAPMTRSRAEPNGQPNDLMREYYQQRASAGLIISEGTQPSENGKGYCRTPGIHTPEQIAGWKEVTAAVADAGGNMVMQIMHCGRVSSRYNKAQGSETVAPSAIKAAGEIYTDSHGMAEHDSPRALELHEVKALVDEYKQAAQNAREAGFAGVELHATSGYLPAQFLSTGTNQRDDAYGGSLSNRIRFVLEVLEAMSDAIGSDRVAMRICPGNPFNDLRDDNPEETFSALLGEADKLQLAYLHVIRMAEKITGVDTVALAKKCFSGALVLNDSYSFGEAVKEVDTGVAAISYARHFVANPDLPAKIASGQELVRFNAKTLYSPGPAGYTDY